MTKRKGLADRIRDQRKVSFDDRLKEKLLLNQVINFSSLEVKDQDSITSGSSKDQDNITLGSSKDQDSITSGSSKDQDSITLGSRKDQDNISYISDKDQIKSRYISDKDQDSITLGSCLKNNYVIENDCIDLTSTQMKVYNWFKNNGKSGYFNKAYISKDTDITYITVRKIIKKFKDTELLFFGNYDPTIRLETYKFNDKKKGICGIEITGQKDIINRQSNALISSSKFLKTNELTKSFSENPELEYWVEKKLKVTKVKAWMSEFNMSEEDMIESLCHCAFELNVNGEQDKKGQVIANVMDWFYSIIKKYHYYDKPTNYKSFEEKNIERAENRLKEKQERLKKIQKIEQAEREADLELKFLDMMSDPSGILFEKCYEGLTNFTKKRYVKPEKRQGAMFEKEMKISFKKILENEE